MKLELLKKNISIIYLYNGQTLLGCVKKLFSVLHNFTRQIKKKQYNSLYLNKKRLPCQL